MKDEKSKVRSFQDLEVWKKAHALVLEIYKRTDQFPEKERYGIVSQIRRASSSVPTNLAEVGKRGSKKDYAHFVNMAESSLEETKYHLILSRDLGYFKDEVYKVLIEAADEVGRMLHGLKKSLSVVN